MEQVPLDIKERRNAFPHDPHERGGFEQAAGVVYTANRLHQWDSAVALPGAPHCGRAGRWPERGGTGMRQVWQVVQVEDNDAVYQRYYLRRACQGCGQEFTGKIAQEH